MTPNKLNLAAICNKTNALGPGDRSVVWVQGCPFRCKGCISSEWIPFIQAHQWDPHELAENLLGDPTITGITISGGEPITQSTAMTGFLEHCKAIRDVDVILFSGYYYENLLAFPAKSSVQRLLSLVDVLIDGPYVESENDNRGMRGSANQRIIYLTTRFKGYDFSSLSRRTEIQISNGELLLVGVPPVGVLPGVLKSLTIDLDEKIPGGRYERA